MTQELADLLFPYINKTVDYYENLYPKREESVVTRVWPSPTGFVHIGTIYVSLICKQFAKQHKWTFFLRVEDTDKKREIEGAVGQIVHWLRAFWLDFDEGVTSDEGTETGLYGPYTQSLREEVYQTYVKDLIVKGLAYPCFMTEEELESIRNTQQQQKIVPWIYWSYAKWRDAGFEEIKKQLDSWVTYSIRLKSPGKLGNRVTVFDLLRWDLEMNEYYTDIVLLKKNWLPTYHLAHVIDDHLMQTTHVIRAEEWLPSLPLHTQLFELLGFKLPYFVHIAPILKNDGWNKRKLSKRKDPEANIEYFFANGYPVEAVLEYLMNIVDPSFEAWKLEHSHLNYSDYYFDITRLPHSWALFDFAKLDSVSNAYLSLLPTKKLHEMALIWAEKYDPELYVLMANNPQLTYNALNIERFSEKDPKRFTKLSDVKSQLLYFYDESYHQLLLQKPQLSASINRQIFEGFVSHYAEHYDPSLDKEAWFNQLKDIAKSFWFASNNQEFKEWNYIGKVGEIAMLLRVCLCGSAVTPDLYETMQVLWHEKVLERLNGVAKYFF